MPQNSPMNMKSTTSPAPEITPGSIDPTEVRHGRTWADVRAEIEQTLKSYPAQVIQMELEEEAKLFMSASLPITRLRQAAVKQAVARAPAGQKKRVYDAFAKAWT